MKSRISSHIALFLQAIAAAFICYTFISVIIFSSTISQGTLYNALYDFVPSIIVSISVLITEFVLMLKHKSHLTDREYLPYIFLLITLQNYIMIPRLYNYTGNYPIYYINYFMIAARFILILVPILLLFASLALLGTPLPKNSSIIGISIVSSLIISALLKNDTNCITQFGGSDIYNSLFIILIIVIYIIAFALNIYIIASNEVTTKNIKKNISYCFLIVANLFIVIDFDSYYLPMFGVVFFIVSNILLLVSSNNY